tara:strand:- start:5644 stop:6546 length:903 start_codon:yes stop_codon:yes gene_type:complete
MTRADDIILFVQVVEEGSFSKVSELNSLTNSVVSKRIARLEEDLGVQLLFRTTRKLTISEAGKKLYQGAKNVKQATLEAIDSVSGYGENITGHVKMSVPCVSGELLLADTIAEFCSMHPNLTIDMMLDNNFVDIIEGGYDLVIRTGVLEDSSLIARHIIDCNWVICATPDYLSRNGTPMSPDDLINHNCLQYAYQTTGASEWEFKGINGNHIVKVTGNFSTNDSAALRKAALGGYGLVYVPRVLVYQDMLKGDLCDVLSDKVGKKLGLYAVYPFTRQPPRKIRMLIEHIRNRYLAMAECF